MKFDSGTYMKTVGNSQFRKVWGLADIRPSVSRNKRQGTVLFSFCIHSTILHHQRSSSILFNGCLKTVNEVGSQCDSCHIDYSLCYSQTKKWFIDIVQYKNLVLLCIDFHPKLLYPGPHYISKWEYKIKVRRILDKCFWFHYVWNLFIHYNQPFIQLQTFKIQLLSIKFK
jgi:hypothetical protein